MKELDIFNSFLISRTDRISRIKRWIKRFNRSWKEGERKSRGQKCRARRGECAWKNRCGEYQVIRALAVALLHDPTNGSLTTLATRARNGNEKMHILQRELCKPVQTDIVKYYMVLLRLRPLSLSRRNAGMLKSFR